MILPDRNSTGSATLKHKTCLRNDEINMHCLILWLGLLWFGLLWLCPIQAQSLLADVEVRARWFEFDLPIEGAIVSALNEGWNESILLSWITDKEGKISFQWLVGEELTLSLHSNSSSIGVQSITVMVPEEGLTGPYGEITFQVPYALTYALLRTALQMKYFAMGREDSCTVVTTVSPLDKNLDDCPHGLAGVQVELDPPNYDQRYYFDMIHSGPLQCKVDLASFFLFSGMNYLYHRLYNPLHIRTSNDSRAPIPQWEMDRTSEDGGVLFLNVRAQPEAYRMIGKDPLNPDRKFTSPQFFCQKGGFVNASPPHGVKPVEVFETPANNLQEGERFEHGMFNGAVYD